MEQIAANPKLTGLLGFNAGYVDTAGFLALNGLFAAHVTGNFVTFGAAIAHGTAGALAKLLALPVFCFAVALACLVSAGLQRRSRSPMPVLISAKCALLFAAAAAAIAEGPFTGRNPWAEFAVGMTLVTAMGLQNAMQRMHLSSAPPSTLMTGTTTQVMIDLTCLAQGETGDARTAALGRLRKMVPAILVFAAGCGLAALAYIFAKEWCFALPPVIALLTLWVSAERRESPGPA
ncbi:YoaK family protein [Chromobacterium sp. CV08]|uniref:YoaK family protein n=1 Tax=Chromobacterium sp. CV08 TaxID=3133274 RepID=UPI003DA81BF5